MKAFLLAAGKGTRLRPLTDTTPKCLMPVNGTPLLQIWLDLFQKHDINEVVINTHHLADQVSGFISAIGPEARVRVVLAHEERLLGSAGTVLRNREFIGADRDFLIAYADNLTTADLTGMIRFHRAARQKGGIFTMGLFRTPDPRACGIATVAPDGRVTAFIEKPSEPDGDLANAGIYVAGAELFDALSAAAPCAGDGPFDFGRHVIPRLSGKMFGVPVDGYIRDIGTVDAYQAAVSEWNRLSGDNDI